VAALLAWVVVICAAIGLGGAWVQPVQVAVPTLPNAFAKGTIYLWGVCYSLTAFGSLSEGCLRFNFNDIDEDNPLAPYLAAFRQTFVTILGLQAASLVLSFIGAIVASVAGCLSQPKGALVASIVLQVFYFIIAIAAWAYAISQVSQPDGTGSFPWSYGFALAIVGTFLSLAVIGLSAAGLKSAPPAGAYGAGATGYNAYGAQQPTTQEPGNPVGGQAMQKA
jgi:hypothetical protein